MSELPKNTFKFAWTIIYKWSLEYIWENHKQTLVIEDFWEYPQSLCVDFWNERWLQLNQFDLWDIVSVPFTPKCKEYNWKRYQNNSGRNIKLIEKKTFCSIDSDVKDDLPF